MENFFGRLKVEMYYGEKFESHRGFIEKLEEVHSLLQQRENLSKIKRNEPGSIPNSFTSNLIFNFCLNFWVHFISEVHFSMRYHSANSLAMA